MSEKTIEERIEDILFEELMVSDYGDGGASIDGREEAIKRIMSEIIKPILSGKNPT